MAQYTEVLLNHERYTRTDHTALRAWLNRLPIHQIRSLYYVEDDLSALGCATDRLLQARLETLRDHLVAAAIDVNPHLADLLKNARRTSVWSGRLVNYLVQAAEVRNDRPRRSDPVSAWFRPRVSSVLRGEGVGSLESLMEMIRLRGSGWWKPVPRLGAGKAARLEYWLRHHHETLGPLPPEAPLPVDPHPVVLHPGDSTLVPFERILLPTLLDGHAGSNRYAGFCLISARHDRDAIDAYLYKFRAQDKTRRAYQKELERFLLWCITVRGLALSSALHDDCEAYKDFLGDLPASWVGTRCSRKSAAWRPFAGPLTPGSQRYAVQAIRFFFNWLVNVRYLGGNPWLTVADPGVALPLQALQIDKALPEALWHKLIGRRGLIDQLCATADSSLQAHYRLRGASATFAISAQFRLLRAALLLIGETGLRREEAALATRDRLRSFADRTGLWELEVLGKRNRWRSVFPSARVVAALEAHWEDRGDDFSFGLAATPLLSPLMAPGTVTSQLKHRAPSGELRGRGFSADGLYQVIKTGLRRIANDDDFVLEEWERELLRKAGPHSFRHTFGSLAVAADVPLDVVQRVLGHASLQTTTIYVQAEKKRSIAELGKFLNKPDSVD